MEILAHRGHWLSPAEKNSEAALRRAFVGGFGVETDVRDLDGELVISHDPPRRGALSFASFLSLYRECSAEGTLALNIKADGLQDMVGQALQTIALDRYFVFDMSVPDTLGYLKRGLRVFGRRSEFETGSTLDGRASGLWADAFELGHTPANELAALLDRGGPVAVVSPELHGRPHAAAWSEWRDVLLDSRRSLGFMLCTDYPTEAEAYFRGVPKAP